MSDIEETLAFQLQAVGLPPPIRELRFSPPRRWKFDFAWIDQRLAVECEGGTWVGGRHSRGTGFEKDCEKYNAALLAGWRVLRFPASMITSGQALTLVEQALRQDTTT